MKTLKKLFLLLSYEERKTFIKLILMMLLDPSLPKRSTSLIIFFDGFGEIIPTNESGTNCTSKRVADPDNTSIFIDLL